MKPALAVFAIVAITALAFACGGSTSNPTSPTTATTLPNGLAGTWRGMGTDSQGSTFVTWTLAQSGNAVTGTVKTQAVDPNDGSCGSCHRNKTGSFTGAIAGSTVTLTMFFAAGADGDPTPACQATLTGTASSTALNQLATTYSGSDSCEGPFLNGTLAMARQP